MDLATSHILQKLDAIERAIGDLRHDLASAATKTTSTKAKSLFSRLKRLPPFWQSLLAGGLLWTFAICTHAYLRRGGDPMALIELVLKSVL
jgi:hypothetical protein